jgi:hypothetical protein
VNIEIPKPKIITPKYVTRARVTMGPYHRFTRAETQPQATTY